MEVRFIAFFEDAGVKLPHIRAILSEARDLLEHPHPFATRTVFKTDGKKILADIAKKNGIDDLYDLKTRNYTMKDMVFASLKNDVEYDPQGHARLWKPREKFPHVIVHPKFAFGHPVLRESRTPTRTLRDAVKAEKSAETVAELFEIPVKQVREAVQHDAYLVFG